MSRYDDVVDEYVDDVQYDDPPDLPDGFRVWHDGDENELSALAAPTLGRDAYHGPLGRFLDLVAPDTEAHPAAIGFGVLVYVGCSIGKQQRYSSGTVQHHPNLWGYVLGRSSRARKGVAVSVARTLLDRVLVDDWQTRYTLGGFGSGEAFVSTFADPLDGDDRVVRKSRVVDEAELSSVFIVASRDGSTFGNQLLKAFDGDPMESRTKGGGDRVAVGHHVGVFGSITPRELREVMAERHIYNGLGNRLLPLHAEATQSLPFPPSLDSPHLDVIAQECRDGIARIEHAAARRPVTYRPDPSSPAGDVWRELYAWAGHGVDGHGDVLATLTARYPAHCARIALVYAALDGEIVLRPEHLRAAVAWCRYSFDTLRYVWPEALTADAVRLLDAIRESSTSGLSGREQHELFGRHRRAEQLAQMRRELEAQQLIYTFERSTAGRPATVSVALTPCGSTS